MEKAIDGVKEAINGVEEATDGVRVATDGAREAIDGAREAIDGAREAIDGIRTSGQGQGSQLLAAACGTYELGARMSRNTAYRAAVGLATVAGFLLVWINLAVGIIGDEGNPAKPMFGGVLVVGVIGALVARFRAPGMARALVATAIAQAMVAVIAPFTAPSQPEVWVLSAFFVAVWLTSAGLLRTAARQQRLAGAAP